MPHVFLRPHGNLGNHMLLQMTALWLVREVPNLTLSGYNIPEWGITKGRVRNNRPPLPRIRGHDTDYGCVVEMLKSGDLELAILRDIAFQVDLYGDPSVFRDVFPQQVTPAQTAGEGELLINVRGAEILKARSTAYGPINVAYYERLVEETGLSPVFLGQLGDEYNTDLLKTRFPKARFIPSQGAIADFEAIRGARHIAVSISTFSWLAAWLSKAETIHLPLIGMLNPRQRPDIALAPANDPRYRFHLFPEREWVGNDAQINALAGPDPSREITRIELRTLLEDARESRAKPRADALERLRKRAQKVRPFVPILRRLYPTG